MKPTEMTGIKDYILRYMKKRKTKSIKSRNIEIAIDGVPGGGVFNDGASVRKALQDLVALGVVSRVSRGMYRLA